MTPKADVDADAGKEAMHEKYARGNTTNVRYHSEVETSNGIEASERAEKRAKLEAVLAELDAWLNPVSGDDSGSGDDDGGFSSDGSRYISGTRPISARPSEVREVRAAHYRLTDASVAYYALLPKSPEPEVDIDAGSDLDDDGYSPATSTEGGGGEISGLD